MMVAAMFVPLNAGACLECRPSGVEALDRWARWDGRWYVEVAERGYSFSSHEQSTAAFFPVYPLAMKLAAAPFGGGAAATVLAGILISNVAALVALALIARIAVLETGSAAAARAPLYLLTFPTTVFLSAVYPEATFLLLAATAFTAALRGRWGIAGAAAALATLTRPLGISVPVALAIEAMRRPPAERRRALAWLALGPAALAGWWAYLIAITGDPVAYLLAQATFRRSLSFPLAAIAELVDPSTYGFPYLIALLLAVMILLVALAWRRLRPSLAACATLILLFAVTSGTVSSSMRYELLIFPAFIVLAEIARWRVLDRAYLVGAVALSLLLGAMFSLQYWIG